MTPDEPRAARRAIAKPWLRLRHSPLARTAATCGVATFVISVSVWAPVAWLVLVTDGVLAIIVVAAAAGWGSFAPAALGLADETALRRFCIAIVLGLAWLSTATLALGCAGWLGSETAWALIGLGCALSVVHLMYRRRMLRETVGGARADEAAPGSPCVSAELDRGTVRASAHALVGVGAAALGVVAAIAFVGATLPPGILWEGEARGYDVLEYHLQVPREYYDAGRIHFLPHNVYASFPQQMEMLYLLLMHIAGGPLAGAVPAQLLHAVCGVLFVGALAAWARSGRARLIAVLAGGTIPWLGYVACLAYVELGMLFAAAVAGGIILDAGRSGRASGRAMFAAGLAAGIAGGCKYTALALITAPLVAAAFVVARGGWTRRAAAVFACVLGAVLAFAPWAVRNAAFTGNPVYPFAYEWFGGEAWSAEQAAQWARGHRVPDEDAGVAGRLSLAARELFGRAWTPTANGASLFGVGLFAAAALGAAVRRDGISAMLGLWALAIFVVWFGATHVPGRFVLPLIVPLAWLAARAGEVREQAAARAVKPISRTPVAGGAATVATLIAACAALAGATTLAAEYARHSAAFARRHGVALRALPGQTAALAAAHELNQLSENARLWLVGDAAVFYIQRPFHYTVVFNRDPWLAFALAADDPAAALEWLRIRSVTHVVFSWAEIERLCGTYGFPAGVNHAWVRRLTEAGLRRVATTTAPSGRVLSELYEVWVR